MRDRDKAPLKFELLVLFSLLVCLFDDTKSTQPLVFQFKALYYDLLPVSLCSENLRVVSLSNETFSKPTL